MRKLLLIWAAALLQYVAMGQNTYQKALGGLGNDQTSDAKPTSDGGFIVVGTTNSFRASISDMFLAKLDNNGDTAWVHTFGGNNVDRFEGRAVVQLSDGGYVIAGLAEGNGLGWNNKQVVLIRTAADGKTITWSHSFLPNNNYKEVTAMAVRGNVLAITGYGDQLVNNGTSNDVFVMTVDINSPTSSNMAAYNRRGSDREYAQDVMFDADGNIVVTGYNEQSTTSSFIIKMDASLNQLWARSYDLNLGYNNRNYGYAIEESGNNYVIAGRTFYLTDRQTGVLDGYDGTLVMSVSKNDGSINWSNAYGVNGVYSEGLTLTATANSLLVGGKTNGNGSSDLFVLNTDLNGSITWTTATGSAGNDNPAGVFPTNASGYISVGTTGGWIGNNDDMYIALLGSNGGTMCNQRNIQNESRPMATDLIVDNNQYARTQRNLGSTDISAKIEFRDVYMPASCICAENPDFESSAPACSGQGVDFRIATGTDRLRSISWTFADDAVVPAGQTIVEQPKAITYPTGGLKAVTLSISDGACSGSTTKIINIRQSPSVTSVTPAPATICEGQTVNFTSAAAANSGQLSYAWELGNGSTSTVQNPVNIRYEKAGTAQVQLSVTNEYGCKNSRTATVTVNPVPEVAFGTSGAKCSGELVDFLFTAAKLPAKNYTYAWGFDGGTGGMSFMENPTSVLYATPGQKLITLTVTTNDNCTATAQQSLTINETPRVSFTSNAPQCVGSDFAFTNTGSANGTKVDWKYDWDFGIDAQPATSSAQNPVGIRYSAEGSKLVTLKVSSDYCSKIDTASIFVNPLPTVGVIADATICANRSIAIGDPAADRTNFTYSWTSEDKDFKQYTAHNPTVQPDAPVTKYTLTVTNKTTGCVNSDEVVITMLKNAIADAGNDVEICYGDTIQIGAAYIEGQDYEWYVIDSLEDATMPSPMVWPSLTTDYILSARYEGCDEVFDTVRVIVHQLPDVKAKTVLYTDSITIALGESTQLLASGAIQYDWTPAATLDNAGIYNPTSTPTAAGTIVYTLEGIDMYGCINYDSVTVITRTPKTWVPTSFSPNGDGLNDVFYVRVRGVKTFMLKVYTRSGEMIFSTTDPETGWDGRRQGTDRLMPVGAYVFYYEADFTDGSKETIKDVINLVR